MTKPTPTEIVVSRLVAAGIVFDRIPNRTKVVRTGQIQDNMLVCYQTDRIWTADLYAAVPGHRHKNGRYLECSLADPIRDLAKRTIHVYDSTWIHGRHNWPELRLSTRMIADRENRLLLTLPLDTGSTVPTSSTDDRALPSDMTV